LLLALNTWFVAEQEVSKARLFDSYGHIIGDDASAHLDNFAQELAKRPDSTAYIICYGPEGDGSGTGNYILLRIKDYLVNARGVGSEAIQTIYAGHYRDSRQVSRTLDVA
jgi:hypothetical protein